MKKNNGLATEYDDKFFRDLENETRVSAARICPMVLEIVPARSVVDVGCGEGVWLSVFLEHGVDEILGIDGDYVDRARLQIPRDRFMAHDLTKPMPKSARRFDLAISLEVAEHLEAGLADAFVASLTSLSDYVLFSAAIPGQEGTHHVNEQWPSYWQARFAARGYQMLDCFRPRIWNMNDVSVFYRQNIFLCVAETVLAARPDLHAHAGPVRDMVHPYYYHPEDVRTAGMLYRNAMTRAFKKRLGIKGSFRDAMRQRRKSS